MGHPPKRVNRVRVSLSRGLLVPHSGLLEILRDSLPNVKRIPNIALGVGIAGLSGDLVPPECLRVVDRHAFAEVVDVTDELSSLDVALRGGCRANE